MNPFIHSVVNIGIRPGHSFEDQKKIRSLNAGALLGFVIVAALLVLNLLTAHLWLACCYLLLSLVITGIFLLQQYQLFQPARFTAITTIALFFSFISLAYHNNTELLLLLNIAVIILLLDSWWLIAVTVLVDMFIFIFTHIYNSHHAPLIEALPASRDIISVTSVFVMMMVVLLYNKYEQRRYRQQIQFLQQSK